MDFNVVFKGIQNCNCLESTFEDYENLYARRIGNVGDLKSRDFKSHSERGKIPESGSSCNTICGFRGVSISRVTDSVERILEKFNIPLVFSPKMRNRVALIKFKSGSGILKHSPTEDPEHHDFFKCDSFELEHVEVQEIIPIRP